MWLVCSRLMGTSSQARSLDLLVGQISASSSQQAKCYSAGTLTTVSDITSISGNITASVGHVSAYGNLQSSSGHITAQNGNISRQRITASGKHISWFHHINGGYYRWNNNINKLSRGHWNNGKTYYPASYGLLSRLRHNSLGSIRAMWRKCWSC